nr:ribonuclease H-like domain-containing protein [Tanacetum cinerariifolium]
MQTQTSNTLHNAIMEAGSKDRPPMLAPGNYVQWKSRIKRYIDTKPNHELIHYYLTNPLYKLGWIDKEVLIFEGSPITRTERFQETYKNVSQDIRNQLNAKAEAVQIILTGIDNDIYSTVDACPNACEMWKAIERAERIARVANPLTLVAQQQPVYHPQTHPTHYTQNCSTRSQQAVTMNRGKAIVNSPQPIYDQEPSMVADDETSKDKEIDKLMALISLSFKKIYKPTNNNLRTSSNTSRANQDNSLRINKSAGYENERIGNVAGECQKPKRAKDAAYHREKMLLCKQKEAGIQLNAEQDDWRDDTDDDELEDQELEVHYMYMAQLQEVSLDAADFGPIFDAEPLQKVSNDDHYNVLAIESAHPEQSKSVHDTYPIEQDAQNVIIDSLDMSYDKIEIDQNDDENNLANECELLASLIQKLKCEIDESKNRNKFLETLNKVLVEKLKEMKDKLSAHQETIFIPSQQKEAQIKLYKTREDKELDKVVALENKVKVLKAHDGKSQASNNFVEKFLGTVKFGNDQIAPILGYGDLKKNDVKARSILLMALPNKHLLTFSQYKDAKTFFKAIQARFGGNDATKKTQRTLLKQMYENFNAPSTDTNEVDTARTQVCAISTPVSTTVNMEDTSSKAMVAIDEAGFDWSYMTDDEVPTNMALMAFSDSE